MTLIRIAGGARAIWGAIGEKPMCSKGFMRVSKFSIFARIAQEWTMPAREWSLAKAQFAILFGERFTRAMA
jgi:hypothetical protein